VLLLLGGLSVWSVATMLRCFRAFNEAGTEQQFAADFSRLRELIERERWDELQAWTTTAHTLHAGSLKAALAVERQVGVARNDPDQVDRAVRSFLTLERAGLERGLTTLATLGSNAPFIGLFGTVLGVIQAFGALGANQARASDIMVGISEALVATAVGLFVAIPAVVAYNALSRRLRVILVNSEALRDFYLSRRH
jgi:biopolymer transport protein ExbB/TolQ